MASTGKSYGPSFHVVRNASKMLDDVRKRVLRGYGEDKRSDECYLLKYKDQLLYTKDDLSEYFT